MFTEQLWRSFGLACLLTAALSVIVLADPSPVITPALHIATFLFVAFLLLVVLSFVRAPAVRNPGAQVLFYAACLALSAPTYAVLEYALSPLFRQPAQWELQVPGYYLLELPGFGLAVASVGLLHLIALTRRPWNRRPRSKEKVLDLSSASRRDPRSRTRTRR